MTDKPTDKRQIERADDEDRNRDIKPKYAERVHASAARKIWARQNPSKGIWFGLGMMGLVGWSVVVPTLAGAALGLWLDSKHWSSRSFTLALLVAGLVIGCFNAWNWIAQQDDAIHSERTGPDEHGSDGNQ